MNDVNLAIFKDFGYREIRIASELLEAYIDENDCKGSDSNVLDSTTLTVGFNSFSGYVFLTDEYSCRTFILNGDKELEEFIQLPESAIEGTINDILDDYEFQDLLTDDLETIKEYTTLDYLKDEIDEYLEMEA